MVHPLLVASVFRLLPAQEMAEDLCTEQAAPATLLAELALREGEVSVGSLDEPLELTVTNHSDIDQYVSVATRIRTENGKKTFNSVERAFIPAASNIVLDVRFPEADLLNASFDVSGKLVLVVSRLWGEQKIIETELYYGFHPEGDRWIVYDESTREKKIRWWRPLGAGQSGACRGN